MPTVDPSALGPDVQLRRDAQANFERVLVAAGQVFATQGLGATLADVASEAGVGVATVYRRFPSKDDLIYEVFAPQCRAAVQLAREASEAPDPWAGFVWFLEESTRELATDKGFREFVSGSYSETLGWSRGSPPPDSMLDLIDSTRSAVSGHLAKLVLRAKQAGKLRDDFQTSDILVLTMAVQAVMAYGGSDHPELYRRVMGFTLDGLVPSRKKPSPLPVAAIEDADIAKADRALRGPIP